MAKKKRGKLKSKSKRTAKSKKRSRPKRISKSKKSRHKIPKPNWKPHEHRKPRHNIRLPHHTPHKHGWSTGLKVFLGILLVVIIAAAVAFFIMTRPLNANVDPGIPDKGVDVLDIPVSVTAGETFDVEWRVMGMEVADTALFFSLEPQGDGFAYDNLADTVTLEKSYKATLKAPDNGALFVKIRASDGTSDFWSDEIAVEVLG